jgi:protease-4
MPKHEVYATAEGEIFLAGTGKKRGLIDEIGGLEDAIEVARKEAKLSDDIPVVVEGAAESILEALLLGPEPAASEIEAALRRYEARRLEAMAEISLGAGSLESLRPFAASISPMLQGEAVVAALPYAIEIH